MKCIIGVEQEPRVQFAIDADPEHMPDLIILNNGDKLVLVGKYASPGQTYSYKRVEHTYHTETVTKEWVRYSPLVG
jgi:hypothetical protein